MDTAKVEAIYALSPVQQGILFHTLYAPGTGVYIEQLKCTISGRLDRSLLERSWQHVLDRHAVLRTSFVWEQLEKPLQVVQKDVRLPIDIYDWRALPAVEQAAQLTALLQAIRNQGFVLTQAPLMQVTLIQIAEDQHYFIWTHHHLLMDGWSTAQVLREVFACYAALAQGQSLRLTSARPYRDYINWLKRQDLTAAEAFWRQTLGGFSASTPLVVDRAPHLVAEEETGYAQQQVTLAETRVAALQALARRHQVTINTLVQGAWALLLSRYSGERDVVFGVTVSGRPAALPDVETMVGLFINTLPVRVHVPPDALIMPWIQTLQAQQVELRQYEYSPLNQVHGWSDVPRTLPLFESIFVFENYPIDRSLPTWDGGLRFQDVQSIERTNYPLTVMALPQHGLTLRMMYECHRFEAAAIERMLGHLQTLLESIADNPIQRLGDIPLLTAVEREQILVDWNSTAAPFPRDCCIQDLFEARVEQTPQAVAAIFEGQQISYDELNQQANQIAHHLRSLGIGPGRYVGIYLNRAMEMIPALLGILKAGGAYVPLEPGFPNARVQWILASLDVSCIVTQSWHAATIEQMYAHVPSLQHVICLDQAPAMPAAATDLRIWSWAALRELPRTNPRRSASPDDIAYIIFTSGSTGNPKGVVVRHAPVINLIDWVNTTFAVGPDDRVLFITSLCFDLSVYDVFGLLAAGGSIQIVSEADVRQPDQLLRLLCEEPVTFWDSAPAALQQLAPFFTSVTPQPDKHGLRLVFLSGDWIPVPLPDQLRAAFPRAQVIALGGATEATIWSNFYPIGDVDPRWVSIPYGKPIKNAQYYVLDARLNPCPIGVPGDLYIGGECLASGYANEPILSAERFLPDPFSRIPGGHLYKTGDQARFWPDGNLEFLGRVDHQVKIRGFRVELGEIEVVLRQHPDIRECVVVARQDTPGRHADKRLVAYLVPRAEPAPTVDELRAFLKQHLPEYMVPASYVLMDALPVTANGKLDRAALPAPERLRPELESAFTAPRTPLEAQMAEIWTAVLGIERIGVHDNFFALGGDSILSIQIVSKAGQAGLQITPRDVFQHQTIAELAAVVGSTAPVSAAQDLVVGPVPLTPIQHWFFEQNLADPHHWNQSLLFEVREPLDAALLERAVAQLLVQHDALRLQFQRVGDAWEQTSPASIAAQPFMQIDLMAVPEAEQRSAIEAKAAEIQASLNLMSGPLLRVAWFNLGPHRPGRLLLSIHHLAVDGVSWRILLDDLQSAYRQLKAGQPIALPPKTTSFQQWAERLQNFAQAPAIHAELPYWTAQPWDASARLPLDKPDGLNVEASVQHVTAALTIDETQALLQEVPRAYRTQINDVLLAALAQALTSWTGGTAALIDLEGHGREDLFEDVDLSRTVGWFTTIYPVLIDIGDRSKPATLLKAVKEHLRRIPHRGLGYGLLRYLSDDPAVGAALRNLPPAEISFNYLGQLDQALPENGLLVPARENRGPVHSPLALRRHLLDVNSSIAGGRLQIDFAYSAQLHYPTTIESLAQRCIAALRALIAHCQMPHSFGYTPSDFPLAQLDQATLDRLVGQEPMIEDIYPLTAMQQGMLFHSLYTPTSGVYCEQLVCTLSGKLDHAAFAQAWQQALNQHSILRTACAWHNLDVPLQIVRRRVPLTWTTLDWRERSAAEQDVALKTYLLADRERGFDLAVPPLMRLTLIQMREDRYCFIWSFHHLLLDGWSLPIVLNDVFASYEATCRRLEPRLEARPLFADYIAWLQRQDLAQAERFWRQQLAGFTAPTPLTVDQPSRQAATADDAYAEHQLIIAPEATGAIQAFARKHHLTLNTLVQGAWALLLSRYSSEADVVFGMTVSGRPPELPGSEGMVGLFINTLPLRIQLPPTDSLLPWLQRLQAQLVELRQYEFTPLAEIKSWSAMPRDLPLFESLVVFENYPVERAASQQQSAVSIQDVWMRERTNYPLTLIAIPGSELRLRIVFDSDRFHPTTIEAMIEHLQTLLNALVTMPERRLADVPLLSPAAQQRLVAAWNPPLEHFPVTLGLAELFAAQVVRTPDAIALVYEEQSLTYAALDQRATQLAHLLRAAGVGPEVRVGLLLDRSLELVIAVLAILKAGGAYVPLDPSYPSARVHFMLTDAAVALVLSQTSLLPALPDLPCPVFDLHARSFEIDAAPTTPIASATLPDQAAYLIYTSGSTGIPKGTIVAHRQVVRLFAATASFNFGPTDAWTLFHSIAFDFSVWELWGALLYGGTLVVVPAAVARTPEAFYDLLVAQRITVLNQVPSAFRQLIRVVDTPAAHAALRLRYIIFGGEALDYASLRPWFANADPEWPQLINMYGITETTVHVTCRPVSPADALHPPGSLIGPSLPDLQLYVLDQQMQPVPVGVPGELYVGGAGLARGYHQRPDLTATRFVPHPWSTEPGARLYRTGDAVCYQADGIWDYRGRVDQQVKLRGFRIELGEIAAVLREHPAVQEVVVLLREDRPGDPRLVAYVVENRADGQDGSRSASGNSALSSTELRQWLGSRLPDYMIPALMVPLAALPLTPSGKLDRQALPVPDGTRPDLDSAFVAPRTAVEAQLAAIWSNVLGIDRIGIYDNYFALGGDSIRSIQVLTQARERGIHFSLQQLFQHQTLYALASEVTLTPADVLSAPVEPFSLISSEDRAKLPETVEDAYPLARLQTGMLFHSVYRPDSTLYHNITSTHLRAPFDAVVLQQTLNALAARHPVLRTSFDLHSFSEPLQLVQRSAEIPLMIVDLRQLDPAAQEQALEEWFEAEKLYKFDWTQAPLLRFHVHRRTDETFQFSLTEHHAILDGWSVASMLTEIFQHYLFLIGAAEPQMASMPVLTFRDFIAAERALLETPSAQEYWSNKLADSSFLTLPRWPEAERQSDTQQVRSQIVSISENLSTGLKQVAQRASVPLKSVLLAAHLRVLGGLSDQADVVTGVVANGRPEGRDSERVLGLFLNTLPFRLNLAGGTWLDLINATFATEHEMLPFRQYPLVELQKLAGGRLLFETAFNFVNFHVYQGMSGFDAIQVQETRSFQETNFTFLANFSVNVTTGHVQLALDYNPSELCADQVAAIGGYYARALAAMVAEPLQDYASYSLLSAQEWQRQINDWNATATPYATDRLIHEMFEAQASRSPHALAVVDANHTISYADLNRQANQLAHHLRSIGVGPGTLVAVWLKRSVEMVPTLLAILKAGGAYVPLEPGFPDARVQWILHTLAIRHVIAHSSLLPRLNEFQPSLPVLEHVICLDRDAGIEPEPDAAWTTPAHRARMWSAEHLGQMPGTNLPRYASPDELAYIIFTSGSTGTPKGVMVQHRPVINLIEWVNTTFSVGPQDRVLFITSLCFDLSVYDVFGLLAAGGSIYVAAEDDVRDPLQLVNLLTHQEITFWDSAPAALQQLTPFLPAPGSLTSSAALRLVFLSGDWIPVTLPDQIRSVFVQASVIGLGGATEATIWSNFYPIGAVNPHWASIPYGRPIQNARYYILDAHLNPVPVGVPGDLYIGGECLAWGYAQEQALTATKFIPDRFSATPGAVMYWTGDRARFWPDGTMEFLGRLDSQVKIRGFRIELGEIEAALRQHPTVGEAVVLVREDQAAGMSNGYAAKRLVAYVVPSQSAAPRAEDQAAALNPGDLRNFLKQTLPEYMIPSAFVLLNDLPVTANGKLDRRRLPDPDEGRMTPTTEFAAPRTPRELTLATIWADVLRVPQVGIQDNFFELGGDSILTIQIVARANQAGLRLTPNQIFQYQTIAELAAVAGDAALVVAEQGLVTGAVPLTPIQHWFFEQNLPAPHHFNQAILLSVRQPLDLALLDQAVQCLLDHHDALRLRFAHDDAGWQQSIIGSSAQPTVERVDLSNQADQRAALEKHAATVQSSLDLTAGPLMRVVYFDLGADQPGRLLLVLHHLTVDGVSWRILLEDLQAAYEQLRRGAPVALPAKTTSYKYWAERLLAYAESEALRAELAYWQALGEQSIDRLPVDFAGSNTVASTRQVVVTLTAEETQALLYDVPGVYQTQINDVLLTALVQAFERWSYQPRLLIDLEGHGREDLFDDVDLSRTVGWFTAIFPTVLDLEGIDSAGSALKAIKEQLRAIPQRGLGYGLLRYLSPAAEIRAAIAALPEAEVSFNYLGQTDQALAEGSMFAPAHEASGAPQNPQGTRRHLLEINGLIAQGQLHLAWSYSEAIHRRATIERLAQEYLEALQALIQHCQDPEAGGYTPSDFPEADLNQAEMDAFFAKITRTDKESLA